jgi:hypothetical protein
LLNPIDKNVLKCTQIIFFSNRTLKAEIQESGLHKDLFPGINELLSLLLGSIDYFLLLIQFQLPLQTTKRCVVKSTRVYAEYDEQVP